MDKEFTLQEIHDIIRFVESPGGKKVLQELEFMKAEASITIDNCGRELNHQNRELNYDLTLRSQGSELVLLQILEKLFKLEELDSIYNDLFKQQEQG